MTPPADMCRELGSTDLSVDRNVGTVEFTTLGTSAGVRSGSDGGV
jgi:hypothetical protein